MSDSIFGKEDIGFRKKRVPETSQGVAVPSIIRFAHKFTGGEVSFSLLNMTTPTLEMPGFTNPSPSVIAGSGIAANSSALRLYISSGGRMVEFESYKVFGSTIQFLGVLANGMPANTIVYGEIAAVAANPIVVGDGRFIRKSYSLAVGATSCPLGITYKVGVNLGTSDQIGDIKVYRNGVLQMRNVGNATAAVNADGNYQEIDAGNGYGTSITFNTPPVGQADSILVEMGYQIASGQMQIWSDIERLQGAIQALAVDAAIGFGQPIANYLSANATELERRAFGDSLTSALARLGVLEAKARGWLFLNTSNGSGSTATRIRRFSAVNQNQSNNLFTYADSAANGASVTFLKRCLINISYSDSVASNGLIFGVSRNASSLTTNIDALSASEVLGCGLNIQTVPRDLGAMSATAIVEIGDVIRPHHEGSFTGTGNANVKFNLTASEI